MPKMTVHEVSVEIDEPYSEGHACTAGEADALNQTRKENIRNNVVGNIKKTEAAESRKLTAEEIQSMVSDYAADYQFGVRQASTRDPVESEAMDMAREVIRNAVRKKGLNLKDFAAAKISELAKNYLDGPGATLREKAKAVVAAREQVAGGLNLDDVNVAA